MRYRRNRLDDSSIAASAAPTGNLRAHGASGASGPLELRLQPARFDRRGPGNLRDAAMATVQLDRCVDRGAGRSLTSNMRDLPASARSTILTSLTRAFP